MINENFDLTNSLYLKKKEFQGILLDSGVNGYVIIHDTPV